MLDSLRERSTAELLVTSGALTTAGLAVTATDSGTVATVGGVGLLAVAVGVAAVVVLGDDDP